MDILIRNVPDAVHGELARRAAAHDKSLRAYVVEVLTSHVETLSVNEWVKSVEALPHPEYLGKSGADWIAEARAET